MWLDKPEQWDALAAALRKAGRADGFGIDTETYGQPDKTSPQHRARIHCWSVGVLTDVRSPRGFRRATGRVLPRAALDHPSIRDVLADGTCRKYAHNAPHDRHALNNEGVEVAGLEDTLQWLRVAVPGMRGYGLKEFEQWGLGYGPRPEFWDMVTYYAQVNTVRSRRERGCICGRRPCHAKQIAEWWDEQQGWWRLHTRVEWRVFTPVPHTVKMTYPVTAFVPGAELEPIVWVPTKTKPHPPAWWKGQPIARLAAWWDYSLADAVRGMETVDWLRNRKPKELVYPWESKSPVLPSQPSPQ